MALLDAVPERAASPVDMVEHLAAANNWSFERATDDEITIQIEGRWTAAYQISIAWLDDLEALHVACAFDIRVPPARHPEFLRLLNLVNEQLWVGHFDMWSNEGLVMYRHALLLAGGAVVNDAQCGMLLSSAVETCDRYHQAFQFVIWAGKTAREALDASLFDTAGEA
jgi:hypothetical protein